MTTEKITMFVAIATLVVVYLIYRASKPATNNGSTLTQSQSVPPVSND